MRLKPLVQDVNHRLGIDCDSARFPIIVHSNLPACTYGNQRLLVPMLLRLLNQSRALCFSQNVVDRICDGAFGKRQNDLVYGHVFGFVLSPVNLPLLDNFGVGKLKVELFFSDHRIIRQANEFTERSGLLLLYFLF